ncbi:integrin alpha-9-like [Antedon mediterranea]|uniref:integrin alpha-9-like n=1 Tax=Antedon mediterranea TaxID=105859 RepID=UPI003AF975C1
MALKRTGVLYACDVNNSNCNEVKLDTEGNTKGSRSHFPSIREDKRNGWLGVSLTRNSINGEIAVCSHLWKNRYSSGFFSANGLCYVIDSHLNCDTVVKHRPCMYEEQSRLNAFDYSFCQAGISAVYRKGSRSLVLGAVGYQSWKGTVISTKGGMTRVADTGRWDSTERQKQYIGYSVSSGYLFSPLAAVGITGAPRKKHKGHVIIFNHDNFELLKEISGSEFVSYFGAAVSAIDFNGDGLDELLVAAPRSSDVLRDQGSVFIYSFNINTDIIHSWKIVGSSSFGAQFGSAISATGDLNGDGFHDVAIGAPYEGITGAVYIYHGSSSGIRKEYAQRICGHSINGNLRGFGSSLSGGIDVDDNGYPDLAIGAFHSDSVALIRSTAVIDIHVTMQLNSSILEIDSGCVTTQRNAAIPCSTVTTCLMFDGHMVPDTIVLNYTVKADYFASNQEQPHQFGSTSHAGNYISGTMILIQRKYQCFDTNVLLKASLANYILPSTFNITYDLVDDTPTNTSSQLRPILNPNMKNTFSNEVSLLRSCNSVYDCNNKISINAIYRTSGNIPHLEFGVDTTFSVHVSVQNLGPMVYGVQVNMQFPSRIKYVDFNQISPEVINCKLYQTSIDLYLLKCSIAKVFLLNDKYNVSMTFGTVSSWDSLVGDNFSFQISASADNVSSPEDVFHLKIPLVVSADIKITGISIPEQIVHDSLHTNDCLNNITISPALQRGTCYGDHRFKLIFAIRNFGPSYIDSEVNVDIQIPSVLNNIVTVDIKSVKIIGDGLCVKIMNDEDSIKRSFDNIMNCPNTDCHIIRCILPELQVDKSSIVEISAAIDYKKVMFCITTSS